MILKSCFLSVSKLITILLYFQCLCSVFKVQKKVRTLELFAAYAFGVSHKMVGLSGLEPPTSRLSGVRSNLLSYKPVSFPRKPRLPGGPGSTPKPLGQSLSLTQNGGDKRDRTADLLLAKQALSQLSYTPAYPL